MHEKDINIQTIKRYQQGEHSAFEQIVHSESVQILSFIRRYMRQSDMVDDVFQEICIKLWDRREQLRSSNKLRSWIFQIVRNEIFKSLKAHNWRVEINFEGDWDDIVVQQKSRASQEEQKMRRDVAILLQAEMQNLKPKAQEILALRFSSDLKLQEIATVMNMPFGTVSYEISTGLKKIRQSLEKKNLKFEHLIG